MVSKKGASPAIAWVLVLGLTIGIATTTFFFLSQQADDLTEKAVTYGEGGLQCESVMVNVAVQNLAECNLSVVNRGYVNIDQLVIRQTDDKGLNSTVYKDKILEPKSEGKDEALYKAVIQTGFCGNVTVMPIISVRDQLSGCSNRVLEVDCNPCP